MLPACCGRAAIFLSHSNKWRTEQEASPTLQKRPGSSETEILQRSWSSSCHSLKLILLLRFLIWDHDSAAQHPKCRETWGRVIVSSLEDGHEYTDRKTPAVPLRSGFQHQVHSRPNSHGCFRPSCSWAGPPGLLLLHLSLLPRDQRSLHARSCPPGRCWNGLMFSPSEADGTEGRVPGAQSTDARRRGTTWRHLWLFYQSAQSLHPGFMSTDVHEGHIAHGVHRCPTAFRKRSFLGSPLEKVPLLHLQRANKWGATCCPSLRGGWVRHTSWSGGRNPRGSVNAQGSHLFGWCKERSERMLVCVCLRLWVGESVWSVRSVCPRPSPPSPWETAGRADAHGAQLSRAHPADYSHPQIINGGRRSRRSFVRLLCPFKAARKSGWDVPSTRPNAGTGAGGGHAEPRCGCTKHIQVEIRISRYRVQYYT